MLKKSMFVLFASFILAANFATIALASATTSFPPRPQKNVVKPKRVYSVPATANEIAITGYFMNQAGAGLSAADLANALIGQGVQISNIQSNCADKAAGTFSVAGNVGIGLSSGIILSSGTIDNVVGPNVDAGAGISNSKPGDADLNALIPGDSTYDACTLEFDFTTQSSTVSFKYVFASEEYNEYVNQGFNDVFGFFIDGVNCATINSSNISINNINAGFNDGYYVNNAAGTYNTEMDGMTRTLTCSKAIQPDQPHHLKLAIADAGDDVWDSNVFIGLQSMTSALYGVSLSPNTLTKGSSVGTIVPYELDLQNLGSNSDTFALTLSSSAWPAVFSTTGTNSMTVGPLSVLATTKVTVYVSVPASLGTESSTVTVTATSAGDATKSSSSDLTTMLSPVNVYIPQLVFDACPTGKAYVIVNDQSGAPITGLTSSNFTVNEDGITRSPISVSMVDNQYEVTFTSANGKVDGWTHSLQVTVTTAAGSGNDTRHFISCTTSASVNVDIPQLVFDPCPTVKTSVVVSDQSGAPITGLTSGNFIVKEDGITRSPISVSMVDNQYEVTFTSGLTDGLTHSLQVSVTNAAGFANETIQFVSCSTGSGINLPTALDTTGLVWTTGGNASWNGTSSGAHDGVDAAKSGTITSSQSSWFQTTVTGPTTLSFWWKVSSEYGYDLLSFYLDGAEQASVPAISGETDWAQVTGFNIPSGSHTLRWVYAKDSSANKFSDTAWVDQVVIPVQNLTVTLSGTGSGSVNSSPAGIACATGSSANCTAPFAGVSLVSLLPVASSNSTFSSWSGSCTGAAGCIVTMNAPKSVTATFIAAPAKVKIEGVSTPFYSIGTALDAMTTDNAVRARNLVFTENVIKTTLHDVRLKGGYTDDSFNTTDPVNHTIIDGSLKIRNGTVLIERVKVK